MTHKADEDVAEKSAFLMMLEIVNEWHRQVGIDDVMKTKLTRKIADTVATGVVARHLRAARAEGEAAGRAAMTSHWQTYRKGVSDPMTSSKADEDVAREICGICKLEIHSTETGVRSFGLYRAHSEARCIYLLQARIEELKSRAATARAEGEAEGRAAAEGQVAMAMDCVRDLAKMPCRTVATGVEDMEPGCCGPCRARDLLSATPASIANAISALRTKVGE